MLATLLLLAASSNPPVVVSQPQERQVVQRADSGLTTVPVHVVAPTRIGHLTVSVRPAGGGDEIASGELAKRLPGGAPDSTSLFTTTLQLPAGGWYRLGVLVDGIAGPLEMTSVERFGVGEVFLVAGQSNSTNCGEERIPALDERVSAFDGATWSLAADPMPGAQDTSDGGSPWPACGQALVAAWNVPVAFSVCGFGGTSLGQWQRDSGPIDESQKTLFAGLAQRAQALGSFRAILWHQGESDAGAGTTRADYEARFRALRAALTEDTGSKAPWVVANVSFVPGELPAKMEEIRAAQQSLWKDKVALQGPDTDDLLGEMRAKDLIHFSKVGLVAHGKRWAERLVVLFE